MTTQIVQRDAAAAGAAIAGATATLVPDQRVVRIQWKDGDACAYPFLWLRDNCPSGFNPDTQERTFDLLSVPVDAAPAAIDLDGDGLLIRWQGDGHVTRFPFAWLDAHRPGRPMADPATIAFAPWRADLGADGIPGGIAADLLGSDAALADWMRGLKATGLALISGLADSSEAGKEVAQRIGFLRETNFGLTFEVQSKPNPNNLAYTAHALPLHTDLPNQELPPGFQFLHCLANGAQGGGSLFADGAAMAEDLRTEDPDGFALLASTPIPFRFQDGGADIRVRRSVIDVDDAGAVREIAFNAHIAAIFDLDAERMEPYYRAYRAFMAKTRDPAYRVELKLKAGEMVAFDNRRVLHGRAAFDPATGFRHLHGCYVDRGEFDSRLRVLARSAET